MSESGPTRAGRKRCPTCGQSMRYIGDSEPARNGHHATVFKCVTCEKEVLRG